MQEVACNKKKEKTFRAKTDESLGQRRSTGSVSSLNYSTCSRSGFLKIKKGDRAKVVFYLYFWGGPTCPGLPYDTICILTLRRRPYGERNTGNFMIKRVFPTKFDASLTKKGQRPKLVRPNNRKFLMHFPRWGTGSPFPFL